ncbi:MAG: ATPase, T2SS/T4P/T4SS family [Planctomycetota bacterium]
MHRDFMGKTQADRPPPGVRERRRFGRRLDVTHPIEVAGRSGGFAAQTVNVSRTGVLLWVADDKFLPLAEAENMVLLTERVAEEFGEGLEVRLGQDIALEAEVVRVTRRDERDTGPVLIACRYARPLIQEEWERLDFERLPPDNIEQEMERVLGPEHAGRDRRRALRVEREQPVEIHSDYAAYRAQVVNVSAVGVMLEMTDPAFAAPNSADRLLVCTRRLGTQFGRGMRVRFLEADVTVEGEIVRVGERKSAAGSDILVSCKFDPPLDPETCRQLGIEPLRTVRSKPALPKPAETQTRVHTLMRNARASSASDLHFKAGSPPRIRVAGTLCNLESTPLDEVETHAMALDLLGRSGAERFEQAGHAEVVVTLEDGGRFRVNVVRQQGHTALALRCLPGELPALPADQRALASIREGLVLIGGSSGSGRSTTLAALVGEINRTRACHILSLEDPVEAQHLEVAAHITQRDLGSDGLTAAAALHQARHFDVDVIAVDGLASREDALAALVAAEAGRLVLAVLDASSPECAIERLVSLVPRDRLATVLRAVSFQRLVHAEDGATSLETAVCKPSPGEVQATRADPALESSRKDTKRS